MTLYQSSLLFMMPIHQTQQLSVSLIVVTIRSIGLQFGTACRLRQQCDVHWTHSRDNWKLIFSHNNKHQSAKKRTSPTQNLAVCVYFLLQKLVCLGDIRVTGKLRCEYKRDVTDRRYRVCCSRWVKSEFVTVSVAREVHSEEIVRHAPLSSTVVYTTVVRVCSTMSITLT